jgi:hypothetical protein
MDNKTVVSANLAALSRSAADTGADLRYRPRRLRALVHEWREILGRQVTQARQVLMKLIAVVIPGEM